MSLHNDETGTMNKQLKSHINVLEMRISRIGCISWKQQKSNTEIRERMGMKALLKEIKKKETGEILRHNTLIKTIFEGIAK